MYKQNGDGYGLAGYTPGINGAPGTFTGVAGGSTKDLNGNPIAATLPNGTPYDVYSAAQAQDAINSNQAAQDKINQDISGLGNKFDIKRILGITPPASS